tara:strand:+ start:616 stop:996 length:381 start_codon:yes stop_codon:yes gene_type:complete
MRFLPIFCKKPARLIKIERTHKQTNSSIAREHNSNKQNTRTIQQQMIETIIIGPVIKTGVLILGNFHSQTQIAFTVWSLMATAAAEAERYNKHLCQSHREHQQRQRYTKQRQRYTKQRQRYNKHHS